MALLRLVGPVHAITVKLSRPCFGQIDMPNLVRLLAHRDRGSPCLRSIEQTKLDLSGVFGEQRKIDSRAIPSRAERIGFARPDFHASCFALKILISDNGRFVANEKRKGTRPRVTDGFDSSACNSLGKQAAAAAPSFVGGIDQLAPMAAR